MVAARHMRLWLRCQVGWAGEGDGTLSFSPREVFELLSTAQEGDGWWVGRAAGTGQVGRIPSPRRLEATSPGLGRAPYAVVRRCDAREYRESHGLRPVHICGAMAAEVVTELEGEGYETPSGLRFEVVPATTSRPRRPREEDGFHYHFRARELLSREIADGLAIEHTEGAGGHLYGMMIESVTQRLARRERVPIVPLVHPSSVAPLSAALAPVVPVVVLLRPKGPGALQAALQGAGCAAVPARVDAELAAADAAALAAGHLATVVVDTGPSLAKTVAAVAAAVEAAVHHDFWADNLAAVLPGGGELAPGVAEQLSAEATRPPRPATPPAQQPLERPAAPLVEMPPPSEQRVGPHPETPQRRGAWDAYPAR